MTWKFSDKANKGTLDDTDNFGLDTGSGAMRSHLWSDLKTGIDGRVTTGLSGVFKWYIPARLMEPAVTAGGAAEATVETTATRPDFTVIDFDGTTQEYAQFSIAMPKRWDEGTLTFRFMWTTANTGTEGVRWGIQAVAFADGDSIDTAFGTAQEVTDNNQSAAELMLRSAATSAVTVAGSPAAGELTFFQVYRDPTHADDDMAQDARLLGVEMFWTADAATDD